MLSAPGSGSSHFSSDPLRRSSSHSFAALDTSNPYNVHSSNPPYRHTVYGTEPSASAPSSAPSSPLLEQQAFSRAPSYASTPASSLSLDTRVDSDEAEVEDIPLPAFEEKKQHDPLWERVKGPEAYIDEDSSARQIDLQRVRSSELSQTVNDDQAVEDEPTRHVDYLSHQWKEEDIWSSWRYIAARRKLYSNSLRLENASWRTWTKVKYDLQTVSPETLNWYALAHSFSSPDYH